MKTLYESIIQSQFGDHKIEESILDSDRTVMSKTRAAIVPKLIVDTLKDKIGEPTGHTSNITKIDKWYPMGYLDAEYIDEYNLKKTDIELDKHIAKFRDELFKDQNIRVTITDDIDKFQGTYNHKYRIAIGYLNDEYQIYINVNGNNRNNIIKDVMVWTDNKEISKLVD